MYIAILNDNGRVNYIIKSEEDSSAGPEVSQDIFQQIWQSGKFGDWVYLNNLFKYDPLPIQPGLIKPSGEIPQQVL
jgi:hypothetical protein